MKVVSMGNIGILPTSLRSFPVLPQQGSPQDGMGYLDIGCDSGEDTIFTAHYFENSVGIDISSKAIELAKDKALAKGSNAKFIRADLYCLPFGDSTFSMVSDGGFLHNLSFEMWV